VTEIVNLLALELEAYDEGPVGRRFSMRPVGRDVGASLTGMSVYELEPGQATWPYHFELTEEEWLIVIDGEVTLRTPDGARVLHAGDTACFPAGVAGAHEVRNTSAARARFAMPSSGERYGGATVYPDSGKYRISGPGFRHRARLGEQLDYWEGET
jgi:uncharacterized cupin superfamily protein